MSDEIWMPIPGLELSYEASSRGRVRSVDRLDRLGRRNRGRVLRPNPTVYGYLMVHPCTNGKRQPVLVHRVVLETFSGPCPDGMEACHNNGDRSDNRIENLRWDTRAKNHADKNMHGTGTRGESNPQAKLTSTDVATIRRLRELGLTLREIGDRFMVSQGHVCAIAKGDRWGHV